MDMSQRNCLLSLPYFYQGRSVDELRQSLLYTTLELEQTKLAVQEELRKKDDQLTHLKDLLNKTIRERDDAQDKYQRLLLEKLLLQQQTQQQQQQQQNAPLSGVSSVEDDPRRGNDSNNGFSSSDCDESIVSSPVIDPVAPLQPQLPSLQQPQMAIDIVPDKPFPEKGKLLQAVMKAGPLLQTLLLAGPLPQWRHPPPPLKSVEIPPVAIPSPPPPPALLHQDSLINMTACNSPTATCARMNRKRVFCDDSGSPTEAKYQRTALH